jgi:hypothetical protein
VSRRCPPCRPLAERLWAQIRGPWIDPNISGTDCWDFVGQWRSRFGYGRIREGRRGSRCLQVHVLAFEMIRGPVPPGKWLRHSCDRPLCANPWHLEPGSAAENYADQLERGRRPLRRAA